MATILMRLAAPMQSWGSGHARWENRPTLQRPSKGGVVGLVCAALGRLPGDEMDDIYGMHFAVRADQAGSIMEDFQTAGNGHFPLDNLLASTDPRAAESFAYGAPRAPSREEDGTLRASWTGSASRDGLMIRKHYIQDAVFLAALTGHDKLVERIARALHEPRALLALGRRNCPPEQIRTMITDDAQWASNVPLVSERPSRSIRYWTEVGPGKGQPCTEQPVGLIGAMTFTTTWMRDITVKPPVLQGSAT